MDKKEPNSDKAEQVIEKYNEDVKTNVEIIENEKQQPEKIKIDELIESKKVKVQQNDQENLVKEISKQQLNLDSKNQQIQSEQLPQSKLDQIDSQKSIINISDKDHIDKPSLNETSIQKFQKIDVNQKEEENVSKLQEDSKNINKQIEKEKINDQQNNKELISIMKQEPKKNIDQIDSLTDKIHDQLDLKVNPILKNPEATKDKTPIKKIRFQDEEDNQKNAAPGPEVQKDVLLSQQNIIQVDEKCKFSLSEKEQQKRLNEWLTNMRSFKFYNGNQLPPPKSSQPKFYSIQIKNLSPKLKMPEEYKDDKKYHVALSINSTLCDQQIGLFGRTSIYKLNIDENGKNLPVEPSKAAIDSWKLFYSDIDLSNTYIISEIVLSIYNIQESYNLETNIGLGIIPIKILNKDASAPSGNVKMKILLQSPRIFMTFYEDQKMDQKLKNVKNSPYEIEVSVNEIKKSSNFLQLQQYLQSNCLISPQDIVPGVLNNKLPQAYSDDFIEKVNFEKISQVCKSNFFDQIFYQVWVHDIKIENLDLIEGVFQKYLEKQVADSGFKAEIQQRKLSCTPSNSCFLQTLQQVTVDIKSKKVEKGQYKVEIPSKSISIQNIPSNRLICLVWRVTYKVKYSSQDQPDIIREFVLGRNPFFLNFDLQFNSGFINDREVQLTLDMCPELGIINDILWNVNESQLFKEDLFIKINMQLSNTEDLISEQQQRDLENQFIEKEMQIQTKSKIKDQSNLNQGAKITVDEETLKRLALLEIENQKLKQINQQIVYQSKQEQVKYLRSNQNTDAQIGIKQQEINQAQQIQTAQIEEKIEDKSDKKKDIQQNQVPLQEKIPKQASVNNMLDVLINREDTDARKLIELLQKLIEKSKDNQEIYKDSIQRLQQQIIFMLERDPFSQLSVFGTSGKFKALQFNNLSEEDKLSIIENSSDQDSDKKKYQILNFPEQNYRPKLDIELKDQFKASSISFKFVAFKTPSIADQFVQLPQRMYFTLKFYMFRQTQTQQVLLRLPKTIAKNINQQNLIGQKFLKGKQYFLMKYEGKDKFIEEHQKLKEMNKGKSQQSKSLNIEDEYIGLSSNSMEINFDFDPTSIIGFLKSQNNQGLTEQQIIEIENQQHQLFCKYLNERVLTIDIWNGDSLMHFGTCKIPLFLLMRQGEQSRVIGQEFDIIDQEFAERIGGLQMVLTNQGRAIQKHKSAYRSGSPLKKSLEDIKQKNKKIVTSNPIELHEIQETLQDKVAEFTVIANQNEYIQNDENLRKQMRVQRLKKLGIALDGGIKPDKFNDENATFWEKNQELKKIQLIREQNKANLISKVTMDAEILNQKTINVISGEANLFELDVNNPFDKKQKFKISVEDQDFMNGLIPKPELILVDNEIQEWDFWHKQGKCSEPSKFIELSSKKMSVQIESCQEIKLLFKFQSFREPVVDTSSQVNISKQDLQNELRPRQIKVKIQNSDSFPIFQILINVSPMEIINDQVFRFYEAQKQKSQSKIPNFLNYISSSNVNPPPLNTCQIISSNSQIQVDISATDDLLASVENKESMTCIKGFIYIYQDKFLSQLIGSCKIEIHSLVQIKIKVKAGEEYDYKLNVYNPCNDDQEVVQRIVEVFSSDSMMVYPPDGKNRNNFLLKQVKNFPFQIPICIKSRTSGLQKVQVNIVCINTREIIEQFLIILDADKPIVDQAYKIICALGVKNFYKFKFKNPFEDIKATFHIMSSNFKMILPKNDFEILHPKEEREIGLIIPEQNSFGNFEAIIHINRQQDENKEDDDKEKPQFESFTQSFLFQIKVNKN